VEHSCCEGDNVTLLPATGSSKDHIGANSRPTDTILVSGLEMQWQQTAEVGHYACPSVI
jgi:hypothetical protein